MKEKPEYFYIGSDGRRHYVANEVKNMQDKTPKEVRCHACQEVIVPASSVAKFDDNQVSRLVTAHKCKEKK